MILDAMTSEITCKWLLSVFFCIFFFFFFFFFFFCFFSFFFLLPFALLPLFTGQVLADVTRRL